MNIGVGGALVRTAGKLKPGGDYSLRINSKGSKLLLPGQGAWSSIMLDRTEPTGPSEFVPLNVAGLQFRQLSKETIDGIASFVAAALPKGERKEEQSLYGSERRGLPRITMPSSAPAIIEFTEECIVQDVGIGGICVRNSHQLEQESFSLIEIMLNEKNMLRFQGRIVSSIPAEDDPDHFYTHIEFLQMSQECAKKVKELVEAGDLRPG
jgi:hypothetical protein